MSRAPNLRLRSFMRQKRFQISVDLVVGDHHAVAIKRSADRHRRWQCGMEFTAASGDTALHQLLPFPSGKCILANDGYDSGWCTEMGRHQGGGREAASGKAGETRRLNLFT